MSTIVKVKDAKRFLAWQKAHGFPIHFTIVDAKHIEVEDKHLENVRDEINILAEIEYES